MAKTLEDRLTSQFEINQETDCWEWTGAIYLVSGYSRINIKCQDGIWRSRAAHIVVYEYVVGPVPNGLQLDHKCRVRRCVNPDHLEPVTAQVNSLRSHNQAAKNAAKTECKYGHPLLGENLMITAGKRQCRKCHRRRYREYYEKHIDKERNRSNETNKKYHPK